MHDAEAPVLSLQELAEELRLLLRRAERAERRAAALVDAVLPEHRASARNLLHYLAVREHDLRPLQRSLSAYGLSSLGRMESIVRSWLLTVLETVSALDEGRRRREIWGPLDGGGHVLDRNRDEVLGRAHSAERSTRIMVTLPSESAADAALVRRMGEAGMDIARINCAHDDEHAWAAMIESVRSLPGNVLVAMDLGGPKLRTGPLEPGPRVVKVKPRRDAEGRVVEPARIRLVEEAGFDAERDLQAEPIRVPVSGLDDAAPDEDAELRCRDARGRKRRFRVERSEDGGIELVSDRTSYLATGTVLRGRGADGPELVVGGLPSVREHLLVRPGDEITLLRSLDPQPASRTGPHRIGCTLDRVFDDARPGERLLFDDGKIAGRIARVSSTAIEATVERAAPDGSKLRAEKGINLPDTELRVAALTDEDRSHLPFVAEHADTANLSFVRSHEDVAELIDELETLGARQIGITLKIETERAVASLPRMLLEAMRWGGVGVMIARGDLAVELGFERLAEVQEEILWLCEAAHVPVIWATQVLDTLAKTGLPSRAEVTDAAMGRRAEAVMLNKGPYIVEAIEALDSILGRMGGHISKKRALLSPLDTFDLDGLEGQAPVGPDEPFR